jgi:hypothetical protein
MCEKIKNAHDESTTPSFVKNSFDIVMQSINVDNGNRKSSRMVLPVNGMKYDKLSDSLPLSDVKKNGEKVVNGIQKKNDLVSPTTVKDQLYNGHLEEMNGSSQSRTKQSHYQLSEMPQVLIDAATGIVIAILNMNIPDASTAHSIRNDARIVLRRLIRSGKVSARAQLNCVPTVSSETITGSSSRFMRLLRSVELSQDEKYTGDEVWSAYTPFDMICAMFDNCTDISERQMVVALRYTMFNSRPLDIASYFVRNKNLTGADYLRKLGSHVLLTWKQEKNVAQGLKSSLARWTLIQHKMVVGGTAFLIYRITKSSIGFNVALLRNSFETEFNVSEFEVLIRLILEMLSNPERLHLSPSSNISMKNLLQLVVTLCDCLPTFHNEASSFDVGTLSRMERLLSKTIVASGRILSMQKLLQESMDIMSRKSEFSTSRQSDTNPSPNDVLEPPKLIPTPTIALPPYQIERLLL